MPQPQQLLKFPVPTTFVMAGENTPLFEAVLWSYPHPNTKFQFEDKTYSVLKTIVLTDQERLVVALGHDAGPDENFKNALDALKALAPRG